jgi:hypothetical protein
MLIKEPGGYIPIASISRVIARGDEECTILQQGRELPLEMAAPAEFVAVMTAPVVPAAPGFFILRDEGSPDRGVIADPVVAWRIGPTKAHPVGLCDQEKNGDYVKTPGRFVALKLPDGSVLSHKEIMHASVEDWLAANVRARSGAL